MGSQGWEGVEDLFKLQNFLRKMLRGLFFLKNVLICTQNIVHPIEATPLTCSSYTPLFYTHPKVSAHGRSPWTNVSLGFFRPSYTPGRMWAARGSSPWGVSDPEPHRTVDHHLSWTTPPTLFQRRR